jgi:hypothetical protein
MACFLPRYRTMNYVRQYAPIAVVLVLLISPGCQWMSSGSSRNLDLTNEELDSLYVRSDVCKNLKAENRRLTELVESQKLDLAKIEASYKQQAELSEFLREELNNANEDLDRVERQFVVFEQRLKVTETKASAVAAVAEVQLLLDRIRAETPEGLDSMTVAEVSQKISTSEELIKKRNYAASVYFSDRAMKILNQTERRKNLVFADGTTQVISVKLANMRGGPGEQYNVIGRLALGTVVMQLDASDDWIKIRTESGEHGWVHNSLVR